MNSNNGSTNLEFTKGHSHDEVIDVNYIGIFIIPCNEGHFHVQINVSGGRVLQKSFDSIQEVLDNLNSLNYNDRLVNLFVSEK